MAKNSVTTPWLVVNKPKPDAVIRLFCFHYGGGSASVYRNWADAFPSAEVIAVQLPGREGRFKENFISRFEDFNTELTQAALPYLDKPYVVFGHSLGAIKSFEWIKKLNDDGLRQPLLYIPSGMPAPQLYYDDSPISSLPEDEFVEALVRDYGDTLKSVLDNEDLRNVFMPQLRADFKLLESYQYQQGSPLNCPILAFAGEDEPDVDETKLQAWSEQTNHQFSKIRFPGDHFFIHSAESQVLKVINEELSKLLKAGHNIKTAEAC